MESKAMLAVLLSLLLACAPLAEGASPAAIGKINTKGTAAVNGTPVPEEATVFAGDRISTEKETATGLSLPGGNQVFLPALSTAQVLRNGEQVTVTLERGALLVINRSQPVVIRANGVDIQSAQPAWAIYEVAIEGTSLRVLARKGTALVKASNRTVEVKEGSALDATAPPPPAAPPSSPVVSGGLSPLWTAVIVAGTASGFAGLALGIRASRDPKPQDCKTVSPASIVCP
jgi:hypothetical protein